MESEESDDNEEEEEANKDMLRIKELMGEEVLELADISIHELRKGFGHFIKLEKVNLLK